MPIINALKHHATYRPEKIAIIFNNQTINYSTLYQRAENFRRALTTIKTKPNGKFGIPENGRLVLMILPNHHRFAEIFAGASSSPNCVAVLSVETPLSQMREIVRRLQPDLTICETENSDIAKIIRNENLKLLTVHHDLGEHSSYDDFLTNTVGDYVDCDLPQAPFFIGFTSGTTGLPKAFIRTRESWRRSLEDGQSFFSLKPEQNVLAPGPMAHGVTLYALVEALDCGQTFYGLDKFSVRRVTHYLTDIDRFVGVPTMLPKLAEFAKANTMVFPRLAQLITGASKFDTQHLSDARFLFPNAKIYQYYGASELSFIAVNEMTPESVDTGGIMSPVGKPFPRVAVTIRDNEGNVCPNGTIGTIYVDSALIASGYLWGDNGKSFVKTRHGATVGDLGMMDHRNNIFVMGRAGGMIISGGNNIYLAEIETALKKLAGIKEAVALGLPDAIYGQRLVGIVEFSQNHDLSAKQLQQLCLTVLERYKIPKDFFRIKTWPMTWSGKIARAQLELMINQHAKNIERL